MDEVAARLVEYMERTTDVVGVTDDRGNVIYLNRAARDRLGLTAVEGRTLTTDDLFPDEAFDIYYEQIRPRILMGQVWSGYLPVRGGASQSNDMWATVVGEVLAGGEVAWLVLTARDITEWRHIHEEPGRHATHDELTGVATRTLLMDHTDIALARARRTGAAVAMMFVDLDDLKAINDSFGHQAGDAVLVEVARRLHDAVRAIDTVARVGGDEFVVLFDGVDNEQEAETLATRVQALLESAPIDTGSALVNVSASAGIAVSRGNEGGHQLLGRADTAMYDAKGERRLLPMNSTPQPLDDVRPVSVHDVAVAVTQRAIVPHFQPVIDVSTGDIAGYQALARWVRGPANITPAASFISVVEGSGVGFTLDLAILRHAAGEIVTRNHLRDEGGPDSAKLYAHVSSRFLTRPGVARFVREVLHHVGMPGQRLGLVIPASLLLQRAALVSEALSGLRDLNVRLVINLPAGQALQLPRVDHLFDELRLGLGWLPSGDGRSDLAAAVELAHREGLRARVVGVETAEQHAAAADAGCDLAEGRFYAPPSPLSDDSKLSEAR
jgi:diguanylate cyclase (GGDEF)-like protein/PAS domain S-box-containing protein